MTASIQEIRKKLQQIEDRKKSPSNQGPSVKYPFWNIDFDATARVRFLPDRDTENPYFWRESQVIKLPFPGIKGTDENKEVLVNVPCMDMFKPNSCPIIQEIKPWWNDPSLEDQALKYWKKRTYFFQGFVIDSELKESEVPENPIRIFSFTNKLFGIIKQSLLDPEFDSDPFDYEAGTDFIIKKTKSGKWADYTTSTWARKETPLTEEQLSAIEEHGLFDLNNFVIKEPSPEALAVIFEMFEASVAGELYDPERWAQYYKPWGLEYKADDSVSSNVKASINSTSKNSESNDSKSDDSDNDNGDSDAPDASPKAAKTAEEILATIRNR